MKEEFHDELEVSAYAEVDDGIAPELTFGSNYKHLSDGVADEMKAEEIVHEIGAEEKMHETNIEEKMHETSNEKKIHETSVEDEKIDGMKTGTDYDRKETN